MEELFGLKCHWRCRLQCEWDRNKRSWLQRFAKPEVLTADVTELDGEKYPWDFISDDVVDVPSTMHAWSFGFSCKDFSSLNNFSSSYKESCIDELVGTTGRTWGGNMAYVSRSKPLYIQFENVPAARRGKNWERMQEGICQQGYK